MNQKLVQIKKLLEIEDIIPMWVAKLTGKTNTYMNIRKHSCCMVGEAHGGNDDYLNTCEECEEHSHFTSSGGSMYDNVMMRCRNNIEDVLPTNPLTLDELKSMPGVIAFVKHWNAVHVR